MGADEVDFTPSVASSAMSYRPLAEVLGIPNDTQLCRIEQGVRQLRDSLARSQEREKAAESELVALRAEVASLKADRDGRAMDLDAEKQVTSLLARRLHAGVENEIALLRRLKGNA